MSSESSSMSESIQVSPAPLGLQAEYESLFTPDSLLFLQQLISTFNADVDQMLWRRVSRKASLDLLGELPDFLEETDHIRSDSSWKVLPVPPRLQRRHVDVGDLAPCDTELFIRALQSPAQGIQVDFDDGNCPTFYNQIKGISNVVKAVNQQLPNVPHISQTPLLMVRPRAWNMVENNLMVEGTQVPAPLFDFGLIMFHCGRKLLENKSGPFFYLSKVENHMEARLWNRIFVWTQEKLDLPVGSIKATVLIENILAAFEMEEILFELRLHSSGLNCGILDYCASIVSKFGLRRTMVLPSRCGGLSMDSGFLHSYMDLLVQTCHRRGALATGGMTAVLLPEDQHSAPYRSVVATASRLKLLEIRAGVDGFLVYDLGLIQPMQELFKLHTEGDNQLKELRPEVSVTAEDLLTVPQVRVDRHSVKASLAVGVQFIKAWLGGKGVFFFRGGVEDSATAEISKSNVWQWIRHQVKLEDEDRLVNRQLVTELTGELVEELSPPSASPREKQDLVTAAAMFLELVLKRDFPEFLTSYLSQDHTFLSSHR